jgi:hypothetical protein
VTGFVIGDITVGNGTAGNFAGSGAVYTCDVTPTASAVTVDVGAGVCADLAGNTNLAATQFAITAVRPDFISGLQYWYDFTDTSKLYQDSARTTPVAANSDPIGCVDDKSSNSRNALQATAAKRPLYKTNIQNSKAAALFDGSNDYLQALFTLAQPIHIFTVYKVNGASSFGRLFSGGTNSLGPFNNSGAASYKETTQSRDIYPRTVGTCLLGRLYFNGGSSKWASNNGAYTNISCLSPTSGGVTLGAETDGSVPENTYIMEQFAYNALIADETNILAYISQRWAIF